MGPRVGDLSLRVTSFPWFFQMPNVMDGHHLPISVTFLVRAKAAARELAKDTGWLKIEKPWQWSHWNKVQSLTGHWITGLLKVAQPSDGAEQFLALGSLDFDIFNSQSVLCDRHGGNYTQRQHDDDDDDDDDDHDDDDDGDDEEEDVSRRSLALVHPDISISISISFSIYICVCV